MFNFNLLDLLIIMYKTNWSKHIQKGKTENEIIIIKNKSTWFKTKKNEPKSHIRIQYVVSFIHFKHF